MEAIDAVRTFESCGYGDALAAYMTVRDKVVHSASLSHQPPQSLARSAAGHGARGCGAWRVEGGEGCIRRLGNCGDEGIRERTGGHGERGGKDRGKRNVGGRWKGEEERGGKVVKQGWKVEGGGRAKRDQLRLASCW